MAVELGSIGVWTVTPQWPTDPGEIADIAQEVESLGFGALWVGAARGDLTLPEAILDATTDLVVATGIVNVWLDAAPDVAERHRQVTAAHPDRFLLGLGPGHPERLDPKGIPSDRPLSKLASYLDELDGAHPPVPRGERVLAALGPRALGLAATRSAGAHPYLVPPEHTAFAREVLGDAPLLAPEQKVVLSSDPATARAVGREALAIYLGLSNYVRNLQRFGLTPDDFTDGGSDRLVDTTVGWGSLDDVWARVQAHLDAGADHVPIQILSTEGFLTMPRAEWRLVATLFA